MYIYIYIYIYISGEREIPKTKLGLEGFLCFSRNCLDPWDFLSPSFLGAEAMGLSLGCKPLGFPVTERRPGAQARGIKALNVDSQDFLSASLAP